MHSHLKMIMTIHNSSNPLISCIITLYTLIFLYFPHDLHLSLSPLLIFTFLLLLFLLRLGAIQRLNDPIPEFNEALEATECKKQCVNFKAQVDDPVFNEIVPDRKPTPISESQCSIERSEIEGIDENGGMDTWILLNNPVPEINEAFETTEREKRSVNFLAWVDEPDQKPEIECSTERSEIVDINGNGDADTSLLSRVGCEMEWGQDPESQTVGIKENCDTYFQLPDKPSSLTRINKPGSYPNCENLFVEWDVGAPLEVIYEDYEGELDGEDEAKEEKPLVEPNREPVLDRYPSLSMYYPETDSDSSSEIGFRVDGDSYSPGDDCFRWEDEEYREDGWLIEIDIGKNKKDDSGRVFSFEEDNLIEIDLSPIKNDGVFVCQA